MRFPDMVRFSSLALSVVVATETTPPAGLYVDIWVPNTNPPAIVHTKEQDDSAITSFESTKQSPAICVDTKHNITWHTDEPICKNKPQYVWVVDLTGLLASKPREVNITMPDHTLSVSQCPVGHVLIAKCIVTGNDNGYARWVVDWGLTGGYYFMNGSFTIICNDTVTGA